MLQGDCCLPHEGCQPVLSAFIHVSSCELDVIKYQSLTAAAVHSCIASWIMTVSLSLVLNLHALIRCISQRMPESSSELADNQLRWRRLANYSLQFKGFT